MFEPLFSLCHITCRVPDGWQNACRIWKLRADHPENCEYVLGIHAKQNELPFSEWKGNAADLCGRCFQDLSEIWGHRHFGDGTRCRIAVNSNRPCIVDNSNSCYAASGGQIIIGIADDLRPCEHWDTRILEAIREALGRLETPSVQHQYVLKVSTGFPEWEARFPKIITHGIVSRAYYERIGYIAWPEYSDYGCDDDFSSQAYKNGVVIERPNIVFPHLTWMKGLRTKDAVDEYTGRQEAWELKEKILKRRISEGFPERWPEGFPR